jgi:hypothetical protein
VLVSIDLAELFVETGETQRAAELARQFHSILKDWSLHRYALATWLFFQRALGQEQAGKLRFREVREYFYRHWSRPGQFEVTNWFQP